MATDKTTSAQQTKTPAPTALAVKQAAHLLAQIAQLAANTDRLCFHTHRQLDGDGVEHCELEVDRLRDVIKKLGWMADLGSEKLSGEQEKVRPDTESWLLSPAYGRMMDKAQTTVQTEAANG